MSSFEHMDEDIKILLVNYFTGEITKDELEKLTQWINANNVNKEYFKEQEAAWLTAKDPDPDLSSPVTEIWDNIKIKTSIKNEEQNNIKSNRNKYLSLWRVAASWIVIFALGFAMHWLFSKTNTQDQSRFVEVVAPLGSKSFVVLPDGSNVWLNAGSKISYGNDFNQAQRKIYLNGEAYFSVTTNKAKPFVVYTDKIVVRAFGTKFNVKAYSNEKTITTTLEEGKIDVSLISDIEFKKPVIVLPRQNIVYYRNQKNVPDNEKPGLNGKETEKVSTNEVSSLVNSKIELVENVKTELFTSWKEKRWVIDGITLGEFVPMIERRYNLKIAFQDTEIKKYKFSGIIQNETVEQIMDALKYTAPVNYSIKKDSIFLSINQEMKKDYESIIKTRK